MRLDVSPPSALAVYAHPDDADISCGGTLAKWSGMGTKLLLVIATSGDKGASADGGTPADLIRRRAGEVESSVAALGVQEYQLLGCPDGDVTNNAELRRTLVRIVRSFRPHTVLFPDPTAVFFGETYVNHRDHRELGWAVLDCIAPASASPGYFPEEGPPHQVSQALLSGTLHPDTWVDIDDSIEPKIQAVRCHESQLGPNIGSVDDVIRKRAEIEARTTGALLAESFRRLVLSV